MGGVVVGLDLEDLHGGGGHHEAFQKDPNWESARPVQTSRGVTSKTESLVGGRGTDLVDRDSSAIHEIDVLHQDVVANHCTACATVLDAETALSVGVDHQLSNLAPCDRRHQPCAS